MDMDENDKEDIEAQKLIREVRSRMSELGNSGEDNLFRSARSFKNWTDKIVSDRQLHKIYELMRLCPTYAMHALSASNFGLGQRPRRNLNRYILKLIELNPWLGRSWQFWETIANSSNTVLFFDLANHKILLTP